MPTEGYPTMQTFCHDSFSREPTVRGGLKMPPVRAG
jgi:hypothetical protein